MHAFLWDENKLYKTHVIEGIPYISTTISKALLFPCEYILKFPNQDIYCFKGSKIHNENGPAIIWRDGSTLWYKDGLKHREDGPAIEYADGGKHWYVNGKRHRVDGPAVIQANEHKEWWVNDERHRENGPAVEYDNGNTEYWVHNTLQPERQNTWI